MTNRPRVFLSAVQGARKLVLAIALLIGLAAFALTEASRFGAGVHEIIEGIGLVLIWVCILGRVWCSLYISGRKVRELVEKGPYSVVRNPLYLFSLVGAAGVGAQSGSVLISIALLTVSLVVFAFVVVREESALSKVHSEDYVGYQRRVPRFIPNLKMWSDDAFLTINPRLVARTLMDGLVFLLAVPIAEGIEFLQGTGVLPTIANLP